jgi:hypothetical protein
LGRTVFLKGAGFIVNSTPARPSPKSASQADLGLGATVSSGQPSARFVLALAKELIRVATDSSTPGFWSEVVDRSNATLNLNL